ncbi:MAG: F0F1 ATP synthase subunit A, partial [Gammaproteobacteria bacterium]|nr:F0F1 ATP synthase subunit A [Gammaproteobacteria bacterium]
MAGSYENSGEYIKHHLTNLTYGQKADGSWGIAHGADEIKEMGFWSINVDSMVFAIGLGVLFLWLFHRAAKKASTDAPSGWQNFVEMLIEFIDDSVRGSFSGKNPLIAPLALTIFVWIFLLNFMDLIAVDLVPWLVGMAGVPYLKIVPTTDPNITFGMSITVFILVLYYSVKMKGAGGFFAELAFHPFPKFMMPINLVLEGVTLIAKPV